jgi:uncharacterized membrane protein YccC
MDYLWESCRCLLRYVPQQLALSNGARTEALPMTSPRPLSPGEKAGWGVLALVVFVSALFGLGFGAAIYRLFSWLESRQQTS